jgi:hypothetical protein
VAVGAEVLADDVSCMFSCAVFKRVSMRCFRHRLNPLRWEH